MDNLKIKVLEDRISFLTSECEAKTIYIKMLEEALTKLKKILGNEK